MTTSMRYTLADLEALPQPVDDTRYEIIDGELFVSSQPSNEHQFTCNKVATRLTVWTEQRDLGIVLVAPGLIFADDDNAAPDVIWISDSRYRQYIGPESKLHGPPELVVEVLSPGSENEHRDFVAKLALYSRRGADEYWVLDWRQRRALVYRRPGDGGQLRLAATLAAGDDLESPLLPGFACRVGDLFPPADWPVPQE